MELIGEYINTPRFKKVRIDAIFLEFRFAVLCGFTVKTHYDKGDMHILGKHIGKNRMMVTLRDK